MRGLLRGMGILPMCLLSPGNADAHVGISLPPRRARSRLDFTPLPTVTPNKWKTPDRRIGAMRDRGSTKFKAGQVSDAA